MEDDTLPPRGGRRSDRSGQPYQPEQPGQYADTYTPNSGPDDEPTLPPRAYGGRMDWVDQPEFSTRSGANSGQRPHRGPNNGSQKHGNGGSGRNNGGRQSGAHTNGNSGPRQPNPTNRQTNGGRSSQTNIPGAPGGRQQGANASRPMNGQANGGHGGGNGNSGRRPTGGKVTRPIPDNATPDYPSLPELPTLSGADTRNRAGAENDSIYGADETFPTGARRRSEPAGAVGIEDMSTLRSPYATSTYPNGAPEANTQPSSRNLLERLRLGRARSTPLTPEQAQRRRRIQIISAIVAAAVLFGILVP